MSEILALAAAGALGAVGRYLVSGWAYRVFGEGFAFGTLVVNVIGCFALALFMHAALATDAIPRTLRLAVAVGFLGAFTTFSTFGYETVRYLQDGDLRLAAANVAANVVVCLLATWAGFAAGRVLIGGA
ncbi:MAG: fluoride efflux transporter CrcB [Myxococcales bacterium]|jgi:CrcB protein|nr:MAG: fluoride efflux transporter CrcB [Myxococcales bacterium]